MLPYINFPFEYVSSLLGPSVDELKLITSFLLSYPLAGLLKRIPDRKPAYKNIFIIGVSIFYLVGLFDLWTGLRTLLISSAAAYTIAAYIEGPFMPWIGFVFLMVHMAVNHISRQIANSPTVVDVTGAQMVLVMKLSAFCWNVHDGRLMDKELTEFQRERAIRKLPGPLNYLGYVFFFPSLLAGPAFDYVDYQRWIETTMFELPEGIDPANRPRKHKDRRIPRSGTPAAFKAAAGLSWIFLFLQLSGSYTTDLMVSDKILQFGFFRRVWLLHMFGFTTRLKYYGVWALTEGACILSGLGYKGVDPKTGKVQWNRLQNVAPLPLESAQNTRAYLENWNINTNHWLRNYMYLRVTPKGKKPGFRASMATFVTSAFWHGFYPGYYLAFPLASFIQTIAKNFRRHVRPFFLTPAGEPTAYKPVYDVISYFATQLAFSFAVAPFILLTLSDSILVWSRVYFYCIIGVVLSMAFFASPAKPFLIKHLEERNTSATSTGNGRPTLSEKRTASQKSLAASIEADGVLGLPSNPGRDFDQAVQEVIEEVQARRRRGSKVTAADINQVKREKGLL